MRNMAAQKRMLPATSSVTSAPAATSAATNPAHTRTQPPTNPPRAWPILRVKEKIA